MRIRAMVLIFLLSFGMAGASARQKVILDCDLGDDIDDAFAVGLILASPEFEVLGLVMDFLDTGKRAEVACRMLYESGREDIPVVLGRKTGEGNASQLKWAAGFEKVKPVEEGAADFIVRNLRKYPGEVILFTVGPVPNLQDVMEKDPDALKLAKRVVSMFGSFYMGYGNSPIPSAEWNVVADAEAAQVFIRSGADFLFAGLDVTTFVNLDRDKRAILAQRNSALTDSLMSLYTLWANQRSPEPDPILYDAVAIGMVLWPELFTTRRAHVKVTDEGYTVIDESLEPNCEIGMSIKKDEFIRRIMDRYLGLTILL
jgi:inosine-uridine nucleoside N-ribohydrolase